MIQAELKAGASATSRDARDQPIRRRPPVPAVGVTGGGAVGGATADAAGARADDIGSAPPTATIAICSCSTDRPAGRGDSRRYSDGGAMDFGEECRGDPS